MKYLEFNSKDVKRSASELDVFKKAWKWILEIIIGIKMSK